MKELADQYDVSLFDRMIFTFLQDNKVETATLSNFKRLFTEGSISKDTFVFDNLVNNVGDLKTAWLKPLALSWHKRFV